MNNIYRILSLLFLILYIPAYFVTYADVLSFMIDKNAKDFIYSFINYSFLVIIAILLVLSLLPDKKPQTLTSRERKEKKLARLKKKIGDIDVHHSPSTTNQFNPFAFLTSGSSETGSLDSHDTSAGGDCGGGDSGGDCGGSE